ncbi:MAG: helix-turn-helix transcriptional regulator [Candidatus Gastranaerophilales bacterium]
MNKFKDKKKILLEAVAKVVYESRKKKNIGIQLLSYEYDLPSMSLQKIEKGLRDPQLSTIWKIANALDMDFEDFIKKVKKNLPSGFNLFEN